MLGVDVGEASTSLYKALKVWVGVGAPDILGVGWGQYGVGLGVIQIKT